MTRKMNDAHTSVRTTKSFQEAGMTITAAEEEVFVLSDEIIDRINGFFSRPDGHHDEMNQVSAALQALINVMGILLCEIDCPDCGEFTIKVVQSSFAKLLDDLPTIRAEVGEEQGAKSNPVKVDFVC